MQIIRTIRSCIALGVVSALPLATISSTARADSGVFELFNDTPYTIVFRVAGADRNCPNGLRDHQVAVDAGQQGEVIVDPSTMLVSVWAVTAGGVFTLQPQTHRSFDESWTFSGDLACSVVEPVDKDSGIHPEDHSIWSLSSSCPAGTVLAISAIVDQDSGDSAAYYTIGCLNPNATGGGRGRRNGDNN